MKKSIHSGWLSAAITAVLCLLAPLAALANNDATATSAQATVEYYRHLVFRESPLEDIRGIYPLTAAERHQTLHFKFVRDGQGRLTEVSQKLGDQPVDSHGSWQGFFWFSPVLKISYAPNQEIRTFYNKAGEQIAAHGKVYRAEFSLDAAGKRQSLQFFDQENQPVDSEWGIASYQWQHVKPGTVIEQRFNLAGKPVTMRPNLLFQQIRMEFGHDDLLDFVYNIDADGQLVNNATGAAVDRIVYDLNGNFVRWLVFDKDLKPVNGNDPKVAVGEHLYDAVGNKIGLRGFSTDGSDKAMQDSPALSTNHYDQYGNIEFVREFDHLQQLTAEIRFSYSSDGQRREWIRFYDGKGGLTARNGNGPAAVQFVYDTQGRRTGQTLFDANMQQIKAPAAP